MKDWRAGAQKDRSLFSSDGVGRVSQEAVAVLTGRKLEAHRGRSHGPTHPETPEALRSSDL